MNQKSKFGTTNCHGDSYLELIFRPFKVFRQHAKVHDASGAVRARSVRGSGYC